MKVTVAGAILLSVALIGAAQNTESPELLVPRLDQALAQAVLRGDRAAAERLFGDDFIVTHPLGGTNERLQVLEMIQKGEIRYTSYKVETEHVRVWNDVAITIGRETVVPDVVGRPNRGQTVLRRYTHAWKKGPAGWRLWVRHASLLPDAAKPTD